MGSKASGVNRYEIEYFVIWNPDTRRFDIKLGDVKTGKFGVTKQNAIALATNAAKFDNRESTKCAVYSFNSDGRLKLEWSS